MRIEIDDANFQKFIRHVKKIKDTNKKKTEIRKIINRQMKPIVPAVKSKTPVRDNDLLRPVNTIEDASISKIRRTGSGNNTKGYQRGNLRRSIGLKTLRKHSRNKDIVAVSVTPRKGKRYEGKEGFYGWWRVYGWRPWGTAKRHPKDDFIAKGGLAKLHTAATRMRIETRKYLERLVKKGKI